MYLREYRDPNLILLYVYKHALINAKIKPKYIENDGVSIQNG